MTTLEAYELGLYARDMNEPHTANPYDPTVEEDLYLAWEDGWYEAKDK